jgi:hypothetical protein
MGKKILSLSLAAALFFSLGAAAGAAGFSDADGTRYETAANVLRALGFIEGYADGTLGVSDAMSRAEFAALLAKLSARPQTDEAVYFRDVPARHWALAAINGVCADGLMAGENGLFRPEAALAAEDAARGFVTLLGYGPIGKAKSYVSAAASLGLPVGGVSRGDVLLAACAAMNARAARPERFGADGAAERVTESGETLLSQNFHIYKAKGQITAAGNLDLARATNKRENCARVDDTLYTLPEGLTVDESLLAYWVEYYWRDEGGGEDPLLLYYTPDKGNETAEADAGDILSEKTTTVKLVYADEKGRETKKPISTAAKFILNGRLIADSAKTDALFDFESGSVKVVTPKGGLNEVVWIWRYEYHMVTAPGAESLFLEGGAELDMRVGEDGLETAVYTSDGGPAGLNEILPRSAIALAEVAAADGVTYRSVWALKSVSGAAEEVGDETVVVNGQTYGKAERLSAKDVRIGLSYTFFIGMDGKICLVDSDAASALSFGYLLGISFGKGLDAGLQLKLLNGAGSQAVYAAAERMLVNDIPIKNGEFLATNDPVGKYLYNQAAGRAVRQVIAYSENAEGRLARVYTADAPGSVLTLDVASDSRQCKAGAIFNFGGALAVKDTGYIFAAPRDADAADDEDFAALPVTYFTNDQSYTVAGYNVDELCEADVVVVTVENADAALYDESNTFTCAFDKKTLVTQEDGSAAWAVTYWQQGVKYKHVLAARAGKNTYDETLKAVENLRRGDLFKIELTTDRTMIKNLSVEFQQAARVESAEVYNSGRGMFYGQIEALGPNSLVIRKFTDAPDDNYLGGARFLFKNAARVSTYLYTGEDDPVVFLPNCLIDARVGDWVVYQSRNAVARTLMIYRDDTRLPNGRLG